MPTRFYLPSTGSLPSGVATAAVGGGWETTTGATGLTAVTAKSGTALASGTARAKGTTVANDDRLDRVYVTEQLAAQTISGTFSAVIRALESNAALDAWLNVMVRVVSSDGATVKATLYAGSTAVAESATTTAENFEFTTSLSTRIKNALALTSYTCVNGDRLSFEFGYRANGTNTTYTGQLHYGDPTATADHALTASIATALVPWIELSQTLTFYTPPPVDPGIGIWCVASTVGGADGATTFPMTKPPGLADGDLLVMFQSWSWDGTVPAAPTDGFAQLVQDAVQGTDTTSPILRISTKPVTSAATEPATYSVPGGGSGTQNVAVLGAFRRVDPSDPWALTWVGATTSNSTSKVLPEVTIPEDGCLWLGVFMSQFYNATAPSATWTRPVGTTQVGQYGFTFNNILVTSEARDAGATGTRTATVTASGSAGRVGSLALRAAPSVPAPAAVLDIGTGAEQSHFQLQIGKSGAPSQTTVTQAELVAGYQEAPYFTTTPSGLAVTFYSPLDGALSSGSAAGARTELRGANADGSEEAFDALIGYHMLRGITKATHLPPVDPACVFAQLHNGTNDRIAIRTQLVSALTKLLVRVNGTQAARFSESYATGTEFEWMIETYPGGAVKVYYNDMVTPLVNMPVGTLLSTGGPTWYFKAGAYNQSATDVTTEYSSVEHRLIDVVHDDSFVGAAMTNQFFHALAAG